MRRLLDFVEAAGQDLHLWRCPAVSYNERLVFQKKGEERV